MLICRWRAGRPVYIAWPCALLTTGQSAVPSPPSMSAYSSYLERVGRPSYSSSLGSYRVTNGGYGGARSGSNVSGGTPASEARRGSAEARKEAPTSLRYGRTATFGSQIARSPISERSPGVFGVATLHDEMITLVTRSTSPTAPAESAFLRDKRASKERPSSREVLRPSYRPAMASTASQTDERRRPAPAPAPARYPVGRPSRPTELLIRPDPPLRTSSFGSSPDSRRISSDSDTSRSKIPLSPFSTVNKDFRKSTLNMNDKKPESSSSESSSTESSESESEEEPALKPPPSAVRCPVKSPPNPPSRDERRPYVLRKFDSSDVPWWADSGGSKSRSSGASGDETLSRAPSRANLNSVDETTSLTMPSKSKPNDTPRLPTSKPRQEKPAGLKKDPSKSKIMEENKNTSKVKSESGNVSGTLSTGEKSGHTSIKKAPSKTRIPGYEESKTTSGGEEVLSRTGDKGKSSGEENVGPMVRSASRARLSSSESNKEFTPGLNRLHSRYTEERRSYRLSRVESGSDWWLDDDKESEWQRRRRKHWPDQQVYLLHLKDIDILLGNRPPPPLAFNFSDEEVSDEEAKPNGIQSEDKLDDATLQVYKDGDYGPYLDLESTIDEQQDEFQTFNSKKDSIVLRTQLSVRVHMIIEKLLTSTGKDLRRALFSLKQIFQEDKDLVHEFVQHDGLSCLVKVGTDTDQNNQNYILRALGQMMLYVDGMNGVMAHPATLQWLYALVSCRYRTVVKTALKLLLVFVEYVESNAILLVKAVRAVDYVHREKPWSYIMRLLKEYDSSDIDLLIYCMTLVNKTLNGLPEQDLFYDQVDSLEEQGLAPLISKYMSKQGTDLDLLRQFQIYEAVLQHEDGEVTSQLSLKHLDEAIRKGMMRRKSPEGGCERRKSRRHITGNSTRTPPLIPGRYLTSHTTNNNSPLQHNYAAVTTTTTDTVRRRRERTERQRALLREQERARLPSAELSSDSDNHHGLNGNSVENNTEHGEGRESVRDLSHKLASSLGSSPSDDNKTFHINLNDMKGIISKAKEGLAKSQSRGEIVKAVVGEVRGSGPEVPRQSESEAHWEGIVGACQRALVLCDLDFTDLASDEEADGSGPTGGANPFQPPPPPPPVPSAMPPSAPLPPPPPLLNKTKKTVKLFWKEVRDDPSSFLKDSGLVWDELSPVHIDHQKLEHLFESKAKDLITKKQQEMNKNKEVIVLDPKRSNAINIGMTKLPPPRSIKTAIMKMDATVMNREGIEKLLTMLPSEEERSKIEEAQAGNPDLPLGSAEQFLLTLASVSELPARLKLWAFKLDYENSEKEIAEPLMDLKQGMEILRNSKTFRAILGTLLSIGIFLNGTQVKGFQIDYLSKVPEVKDTVHKHSLLHHLCSIVMEKFPDSTDLYSEIGAVTRASKVDFEELSANITKMEHECKASFEHLKAIVKHDGQTNVKPKMSDFLADCAERIVVLGKIEKRVMSKFRKFCLWLGMPMHRLSTTSPNQLCRIVSEFALEYRTTRERVLQQIQKKASHRERNKTRGKMITEVGKVGSQEDRADAELRQLLGNESSKKMPESLHGSLPWRRARNHPQLNSVNTADSFNGNATDADDEILESLVKTATKTPVARTTPRERKRTRNAERKSLRRTLRNGLSEEERQHLAAYIKGY